MGSGLESTGLLQPTVLWEAIGVDDYGETRVGEAVEIYARWELGEARKGEAGDESNVSRVLDTDSKVYVDQLIPVGSLLRECALADLPDSPDNLYRVISNHAIPDVKCRNVRRWVTIETYSDTLPGGP